MAPNHNTANYVDIYYDFYNINLFNLKYRHDLDNYIIIYYINTNQKQG